MPFDPNSDFPLFVDLLEAVSFRRAGSDAATMLPHVLRRRVTMREAEASGGKYARGDAVFHLPAGELTEYPRLGDELITTDDARWTILEIQSACGGRRLRCVARNQAVASEVNERITIQQATWSKSPSGAASAAWETWLENVPARIQPERAEVVVQHERRGMRVTHRVILAERIAVDENYRILDAAGNVYHVVGMEQTERIDVLPVILAARSPWPLA